MRSSQPPFSLAPAMRSSLSSTFSSEEDRVAAMPLYAQALLVGTIAWGAFAFGSVYPWAYGPLTASAVAVALASFLAPRRSPVRGLPGPQALHLGLFSGTLALFAGAV